MSCPWITSKCAFSLIHMAHLSGNTSGVSNLLTYTGFPGDMCLTFFNVLPGNKDAVMPKPLRKKRDFMFTTETTSAYQHQLNAGFSKVCEIFKVCDRIFKIHSRVLHTSLLLWWDFHALKRDAETNCDWFFDMSVKRPHERALANESCHGFQTFSRHSECLAMQEY